MVGGTVGATASLMGGPWLAVLSWCSATPLCSLGEVGIAPRSPLPAPRIHSIARQAGSLGQNDKQTAEAFRPRFSPRECSCFEARP